MTPSKYVYNPETCRYEPSRTSLLSVVGSVVLFCISTAFIFGGLLFLHSKLFMSETGKALQKENNALVKHQASLKQDLIQVNAILTNLNGKNSELHKKIFETPLTHTPAVGNENESLILTNEAGFKKEVLDLKNRITKTANTSSDHNAFFTTWDIKNNELNFLLSVPSIQPIENPELTRLVSGFGNRINPFHKGIYHHPGVDFAAARGTSVLATAKGVVVDIKNGSSLQAGYGNYVEIDHGNGLITRYAHLDAANVRIGQRVSKGSVIGTVGMSGGAIAPHVHYEIIRDNKQVDPVPYLLENLTSKDYAILQDLSRKKNQSLD